MLCKVENVKHSVTSGLILFYFLFPQSAPLYIWRSRSLSRAALCSSSGTPTSFTRPHWQSLAAGNIGLKLFLLLLDCFTLVQLLGFAKFNVMLNKAPLDLSCHSTDVSWEFQPIKITLSRTRYFYSNFRSRLAHQSPLLLHRYLENWVESRMPPWHELSYRKNKLAKLGDAIASHLKLSITAPIHC